MDDSRQVSPAATGAGALPIKSNIECPTMPTDAEQPGNPVDHVLAPQFDNIPPELKKLNRWVVWKG